MGCGSSSQADDDNNNQPARKPPPKHSKANGNQANGSIANTSGRNQAKDSVGNKSGSVGEQGCFTVDYGERREKNDLPELKAEPEIEDVDVPRTEPGYPPMRPATSKKADIFHPVQLKNVEARARQTPADKASDYQTLIAYLTGGLRSDMEKLRAIFVWLGCQGIDMADYSDVTDSDTPRGFMKLMKDHRASYASFFAVLCRHAGIPCVIIAGYAKSAGYEVGDSEERIKQLLNSWNAVHVAGGWRLVFPLWACRAVVGHSTGTYTKVETKGQAVREKEVKSEGVTVTQLNDYYFLTDPDHFVYSALPTDPRHQLVPRPWSMQKFADVPYCRQTYFRERAEITSKFSCRLKTNDGICHVELTCDKPSDMTMNYELFFNHEESGKEISSSLQLNNFVFLNRTETKWNFGIRFPETGIYKLEITGGRGSYEADMCYFKIFCDDAQEDCKPLPVNPGSLGFGPSMDTEKAGLKAISHKNGLVKVSSHKQYEFNFNITKAISIKTELVHNTIAKDELDKCVRQTQTNKNLNVQVTVPEQGEFALLMHAQQKGQSSYKNVCNYLLTSEEGKKKRTRAWENPVEKNTRNMVQNMSKSRGTRDIDDLERAIAKFEKLELDDKGDLASAHEALEFKKIQKELRDAINRRHLETLEKAITHGNESRFKDKLTQLIKDAEDVRDHLRHLTRIAHDVLEMKQTTIAELRSYKYPPSIIYDIMLATFIMLGEKKEYIEDYEDLTVLMGRTGKESLLRRVRQFDTVNVQPDTQYYVDRVLNDHTEDEARAASAGAGTFYVWLRNVSKALDNQEQEAAPAPVEEP